MEHLFVTGTDTDVGKTIVCGGLLRMLEGHRSAAYWKPVQTGTLIGEDRRDLIALTGLPESRFRPSTYLFPDPVSPHLAAERWKKTIDPDRLDGDLKEYRSAVDTLIMEGAGGVLVPLSADLLLADWVARAKLTVLLVVEDRLGAINQALLSLEALRRRDILPIGFVLTKATGQWGNRQAIERHGAVPCLGEFRPHGDARTLISNVAADTDLRRAVGLPVLPL